jgi:MFS family permease
MQQGSILGAPSLSYLITSPIFGVLLIKCPCRLLILYGIAAIILGNAMFAVCENPALLIIARSFTGIGNAGSEVSFVGFVVGMVMWAMWWVWLYGCGLCGGHGYMGMGYCVGGFMVVLVDSRICRWIDA